MESAGVLRHFAFFEALAAADESDPGWKTISAGLVVMRLVDQWIEDGKASTRLSAWSVNAVRDAIDDIPQTTPLRRSLTGIVDGIVSQPVIDMHTLSPRLMAYGQALEYDSKWSLAIDVYRTIVEHAHPVEAADIAVSAHIQLAFCLRTVGDLEGSASAYERAAVVANASGNIMGVLRARLGDALLAIVRGNLPSAEAILDETISRSSTDNLRSVRSQALHERAHVAGLRGQYDNAVRYAYDALEIESSPRNRDRILNDIATAFTYLGLLDVASDAYLILSATAQEQYIRWLAELNLLEIAARQNNQLAFDRYRRGLDEADFTPQLRVLYLIHVGRGYNALGRAEDAIPRLEEAIQSAARLGFNQLLFEAEEALAQARVRRMDDRQTATSIPAGVSDVAGAIKKMREVVTQAR
jgi:tetratricopeptide (TPR) repeat protein